MITKRITGVFDTRDGGEQAVQALLQHDIAPERLSMFVGAPVAGEEHNGDNGDSLAGEATGALVGAGLTGLVTFVVPGIGILLRARPGQARLSWLPDRAKAIFFHPA